MYTISLLLWVVAEAQHVLERCHHKVNAHPTHTTPSNNHHRNRKARQGENNLLEKQLTDVAVDSQPSTPTQGSIWPTYNDLLHNDLTRCLSFEASALAANRATLRNVVEFGSIMMWWYCVDRTNLLGSGVKETRLRDLWVVFAVLTGVAAVTSIKQAKAPVLLNRPQTEEWKGWMQVCFFCRCA